MLAETYGALRHIGEVDLLGTRKSERSRESDNGGLETHDDGCESYKVIEKSELIIRVYKKQVLSRQVTVQGRCLTLVGPLGRNRRHEQQEKKINTPGVDLL